MKVGKGECALLKRALTEWREQGILQEAQFQKLLETLSENRFDWGRLSKYAFWVSAASVLIAINAIVAHPELHRLLGILFSLTAITKCLGLSLLASLLFFWGATIRKTAPSRIYSAGIVFLFAAFSTAGAVSQLGYAYKLEGQSWSIIVLLSCVLYMALGLVLQSGLVWVFSLLSLGIWFGMRTGYASGEGAYFLGMGYPLRFVVFGFVIALIGLLGERFQFLGGLHKTTLKMGLFYFFVSLLILSIAGNYQDFESWKTAGKLDLFHWCVLSGIASLVSIYHGLRFNNSITKGFGITFLLINLYTRYYEYFWNPAHKALFFTGLAVSFWYIGRKAESLWKTGKESFRQEKLPS